LAHPAAADEISQSETLSAWKDEVNDSDDDDFDFLVQQNNETGM